jgi:hypothetical protein
MLLLVGGVAILCGVLLLLYLFLNADPARVARILKWTGLILAVLAILALAFYGRLAMFFAPLAVLVPLLRRFRSGFSGFSSPSTGQSSDAETAFIRMHLDHDTGAMSGTVLQGRFAGMRVEELALPDLLALLRECRTADADGARLIEAYLDRAHPNWRDELRGAGDAPPHAARPDVTVDEAYAILGLTPGADEAAIRAAHHHLMKQFHPDHGGSDYLATKINRARDVLLHK